MLRQQWWSAFSKKVLTGRSGLGIDIGSGSLKIVEIRRRGSRAIVEKISIADFPGPFFSDGCLEEPAELAALLGRQLAVCGFTGRRAALAVGGRALLLREIVLPRMPVPQLREAIKWELAAYIPYPPHSCYYDFSVLGPADDTASLRVLLAVAPKTLVDGLTAVVKSCGIKPAVIDGEPFALRYFFPPSVDFLVLDIGCYLSQIILYHQSVPVVTRVVPISGQLLTETAATPEQIRLLEELAWEIRRTVDFYQNRHKHWLSNTIMLTGGGAGLADLPQQLRTVLNIDVVWPDFDSAFEYSPAFDDQYIRQVSPRLTVAAGLALRGG